MINNPTITSICPTLENISNLLSVPALLNENNTPAE